MTNSSEYLHALFGLDDQVAVVIGGTGVLGGGLCDGIAQAGAKVIVAGRSPERGEQRVASIRQAGGQAAFLPVDVCARESMQSLWEQTLDAHGRVDVLVNCAGVNSAVPYEEVSDEDWHRVIDINLWGVLHGIKVFLPKMLQHGEEGHIVNTASFSGIHGHGHQSGYGTSKFAVVGLSEFLRNDLNETNIGVSVLCPHVVDTPIIDALKKRVSEKVLPMIEEMAVPSETVGSQVMQAILTNEFYIFCDGTHTRDMLEKRCSEMIAAMDRQFPN